MKNDNNKRIPGQCKHLYKSTTWDQDRHIRVGNVDISKVMSEAEAMPKNKWNKNT